MKKYTPYIISVSILFFAALVSSACGVATTLPTAAPVTKRNRLNTVPTMAQVSTSPAVIDNWIVANSGGLYVRTSAGTSSPVIGLPLADGAQVVIVGLPVTTADGAQWVEIATAENGGLTGWVNFRYLVEAR